MGNGTQPETRSGDDVFRPETWLRSEPNGPVLLAGKCRNCGALTFPTPRYCPDCLEDGYFETVRLSREGVLYAYSTVRVPTPGLESPYTVGYVDLPEGIRIFAQLAASSDQLRVNCRMILKEGEIRRMPSGDVLIGYKFAPVESLDSKESACGQ